MVQTIQDVVKIAVEKCGGQSALAREITRRYGVEASQQRVAHLLKSKGKVARRSELMPFILRIAGMSPTWSPAQVKASKTPPEPVSVARVVPVKIIETGKVERVELTREVLRVAKALMGMEDYDRQEVIAKVTAIEIRRKAARVRDSVPDDKLHHLARTDTAEGRALAAKGAPAKKRLSKHSS